jgi:hypothetical protein
MKQIILIATMLLTFGAAKAQIGKVKVKNGYAMIYDEDGKFSQKSIRLDKNDELNGYNSKYIVITSKGCALIYDYTGRYTQNISLSGNAYVEKVTSSAILIAKKGYIMYYDFDGKHHE